MDLVDGKTKTKTSLNAIRNGIGGHGQPRPFILHVVAVELIDAVGDTFAVPALGLQ